MTIVTSIYEAAHGASPDPARIVSGASLSPADRVRLPHSRPVEPTARLLEL